MPARTPQVEGEIQRNAWSRARRRPDRPATHNPRTRHAAARDSGLSLSEAGRPDLDQYPSGVYVVERARATEAEDLSESAGSGRARLGAGGVDDVGNPLGVDSGLRAVGRGSGRGGPLDDR